jgi:D-psicose/D-tagatose/L-ribulose 3-epimerase
LSVADRSIRERAVARLTDYVDLAAVLGAVVVVGLMQGRRSDEPDPGAAHGRIADCLRRVAEHAERAGARVVIEPVNHLQVGFHNDVAAAAGLASEVGSPALGYMLDTMHLNIEERSVEGAIRRHGAGAGHFHLCETHGGAFGAGGLDFAGVFAALRAVGYDRAMSVKVYRDADWEAAATQAASHLQNLGALAGERGVR